MATLVERERSDEFRQLPPPPSESAEAAWNIFDALTGVEHENMRNEAREIVKIVFDFGGTKGPEADSGTKKGLHPNTYEAAYLMPIMKKLSSIDSVERDAAIQALGQYNSGKSKDPAYIDGHKYIRRISGDIVEIDEFLKQQYEAREEIDQHKPGDTQVLERQYRNPYLKKYKKGPFEAAVELMADKPDDLVKDPKGVNIESVLLSGASAYYALRNSDDLAEDSALKTIYAAETFYQPALDILSFGALGSMAFPREVDLIRLSRNGGKYEKVIAGKTIELTDEKLAMAREVISQLPSPEKMPEIAAHLLYRLTNMHAEPVPVLNDTSGHGTVFMAGKLFVIPDKYAEETGITELDLDALDWRGREQTDVKFAGKITIKTELNDDGKEETVITHGADLLAMTIISETEEELWTMYERVAVNADVLYERTTPIHSRNKKTPLHVSGERLTQLAQRDSGVLGEIDTTIKQSGYEAAKITMVYKPAGYDCEIPCEIAFQTVKGRFDARVGEASHAFQDDGYINTPHRIRVSKDLHVRRNDIGKGITTPLSGLRADKLFQNFKPKKIKRMGATGIRTFFQSDEGGMITLSNRRP